MQSQRLDGVIQRAGGAMDRQASFGRQRFAAIVAGLEVLSPLKALERGYSIVTRSGEKMPIKRVAELGEGDRLDVRMQDGMAEVIVEEIESRGQ